MKKILYSIVLLVMFNVAYAQEETKKVDEATADAENVDQAKSSCALKYTASIMFGRDNFLGDVGLALPLPVPSGASYGTTRAIDALNDLMRGAASAVNMIGAKGRVFVTEEIAVSLKAAATGFRNPAQEFVQGFTLDGVDLGGAEVVIPDKLAVPQATNFLFNLAVGGEYHFRKGNFSPFAGLSVPFYYARLSQYDPTFRVVNGMPQITDIGVRVAEMFGFGANITAGVDYYLKDNLYFGFEIKPFSFVYAYSAEYPAPGLPAAKSAAYGYGVFSQPLFKVGFVF